MDKTAPRGTPKILFILIIAILAGMYYYAAYVEFANPEKTVSTYYEAALNQDYDTQAQNLSVFILMQFPQYMYQDPSDLLKDRPAKEQELRDLLAKQGESIAPPEGISIDIMPEYTRKGTYSALVAYNIIQEGEPAYTELAMLIKEAGRYRIISTLPIPEESLKEITDSDIAELDKSFQQLLGEQPQSPEENQE